MADRSGEPHRYGERGEKVRILEGAKGLSGEEDRGCTGQGGQLRPRPVQGGAAVNRPQSKPK